MKCNPNTARFKEIILNKKRKAEDEGKYKNYDMTLGFYLLDSKR